MKPKTMYRIIKNILQVRCGSVFSNKYLNGIAKEITDLIKDDEIHQKKGEGK